MIPTMILIPHGAAYSHVTMHTGRDHNHKQQRPQQPQQRPEDVSTTRWQCQDKKPQRTSVSSHDDSMHRGSVLVVPVPALEEKCTMPLPQHPIMVPCIAAGMDNSMSDSNPRRPHRRGSYAPTSRWSSAA
ncbi:expressed unknown protein [Seminavis robusta]|uniref:Uncharacterized protein n=1 Tax=Seminavis robusta TaxID=568900 RepID=A0A9N8E668_9STRA|nr:expressed unknown protein [Seminavis robusta]|eukprot:Sro591_g172001.1  (130) ;mRNA; f:23270-23659